MLRVLHFLMFEAELDPALGPRFLKFTLGAVFRSLSQQLIYHRHPPACQQHTSAAGQLADIPDASLVNSPAGAISLILTRKVGL